MTSSEILTAARELASAKALSPWRSLMLVLLAELARIDLPREVRPAMDVAQEHWTTDNGDLAGLAEAKATCWSYLGQFPPGRDVEDQGDRHVRALLCVLET